MTTATTLIRDVLRLHRPDVRGDWQGLDYLDAAANAAHWAASKTTGKNKVARTDWADTRQKTASEAREKYGRESSTYHAASSLLSEACGEGPTYSSGSEPDWKSVAQLLAAAVVAHAA